MHQDDRDSDQVSDETPETIGNGFSWPLQKSPLPKAQRLPRGKSKIGKEEEVC